jgi:hypothetical protein
MIGTGQHEREAAICAMEFTDALELPDQAGNGGNARPGEQSGLEHER